MPMGIRGRLASAGDNNRHDVRAGSAGLLDSAARRAHDPPVLGSSSSRRPWWSESRIRVQTMPWHRSSRICPQVKDPQASIARLFTKRLLTERRPSGAGSRPSATPHPARPGRCPASGRNARCAWFAAADLRRDFLWAVLCAFMCVALPGRRLTVGPRQSGQALPGFRPRCLERGRAPP